MAEFTSIDNIFTQICISTPPIDVLKIAEHLNIKIVFEEFEDDTDGLLLIKEGKATIAVNADQHTNRQRFTIAHELGHYCLHATRNSDELYLDHSLYHRNSASSEGTRTKEIEANRFAAELLMPKSMLVKTIQDEDLDLSKDTDLLRLANIYIVSEKAMGYRLGNLDLWL